MHIWVDADACPAAIKEILYRAARRTGLEMTLVANHFLRAPKSGRISFVLVAAGSDVADNEIVKKMQSGDLVITADIPLAARVIEKQGFALNPRGELYSVDSIRERLSMRNFMETLRSNGVETGGPVALGARDRMRFANALDRLMTQQLRDRGLKS